MTKPRINQINHLSPKPTPSQSPHPQSYKILLQLAFVLLFFLLASCNAQTPPATPTPPTLAAEIVFYDWEEDMPHSILEAFTEEYGVAIQYVTYETQEEALANIIAGEVYDVVVIDNDFLPELTANDLLAPIDYRNVANFDNISANFRDLIYDPGNRHSIPFNWGTTALLIRADLISGRIESWHDLWNPHFDGVIALRDEPREPLGVALKALGFSANSEAPSELAQALEYLLTIKEKVVLVESYAEGAVPLLADGSAVALVGWAEDVIFARDEGVLVTYVYPKEGAMLWGDNYVIPVNSPHKYTAEIFLNFLLRPEIAAQIVNENYYATPNEAAYPHIESALLDDPIIFPPAAALEHAEVLLPLSLEGRALYNEVWEQFKTALK